MIDRDTQSMACQVAEADHRISNHLAFLAGYVRLKGADLVHRAAASNKTDLSLFIDGIGAQIMAISQVHRLLSSDGTLGSADLGHHMGAICCALRSGISRDVITLESFASDCTVPLHRLLPTTQIVTEVITNAIKYGDPLGQPGMIKVACGKHADGTVSIEIQDNGPGLSSPLAEIETRGFGSRLVQTLVEQIEGTIEYISTDHGLTVRLSLPRVKAKVGTAIHTKVGTRSETTEILACV